MLRFFTLGHPALSGVVRIEIWSSFWFCVSSFWAIAKFLIVPEKSLEIWNSKFKLQYDTCQLALFAYAEFGECICSSFWGKLMNVRSALCGISLYIPQIRKLTYVSVCLIYVRDRLDSGRLRRVGKAYSVPWLSTNWTLNTPCPCSLFCIMWHVKDRWAIKLTNLVYARQLP